MTWTARDLAPTKAEVFNLGTACALALTKGISHGSWLALPWRGNHHFGLARDHGLRISPLVNTDRKGGAFLIMLQQFLRVIGVAIVRGNARHTLSRLHYVRTTPEEAAATCRANHSNNRWKQHQHGRTSWFSQHTPDGYRTYEQFRNGYDFCVP